MGDDTNSVTGDLKAISTTVMTELLKKTEEHTQSPAVCRCIKESVGRMPMNNDQAGELAGLGKKKKGRVTGAGKGVGTFGGAVLAVVVAHKLLSTFNADGDALFTFGGKSKAELGVREKADAFLVR